MDWARAIEINRLALARIVAELFALIGVVAGSAVEHLPDSQYLAAKRLLRPVESALRRLIVIAARGLCCESSCQAPHGKGVSDCERDFRKNGLSPV